MCWCAHLKIGQMHGGGGGTCHSSPIWIAPKPSASGITHGVRMTPARSVGASSCTRRWYGPKPLTTMVASVTELVLRWEWILWPKKYCRSMVHFYVSSKQLQQLSRTHIKLVDMITLNNWLKFCAARLFLTSVQGGSSYTPFSCKKKVSFQKTTSFWKGGTKIFLPQSTLQGGGTE
jgi:hypothetical protein